MEGGSKSVCSGNTKCVGYRLSHLLIRQELKPGEVLLGRIAAFLHTTSLLRPVQGEDVRHSKEHKSRTFGSAERLIFGDRAGTCLELQKRHVKCYFSLQFYPSFTGRIQ